MSIAIMTQVWQLHLPDSEKIVMLALADCANDEGLAWPSMATIARKCSKSERTCQGVVKSLEAKGLILREQVIGKGCRYWVKPTAAAAPAPRKGCTSAVSAPRKGCAPAGIAPPQGTTAPPAAAAPKPSGTPKPSEAKASSGKRAGAADPWGVAPDGVCAEHWRDFLANRRSKRLPNTPTAHARLLRDLDRFADAEWPPGLIVQHAAERGWAGIYDPRELRGKDGQRTGFTTDGRPSGWAARPGMAGAQPVALED